MTRQPLELGDVLSGRALLALHDVELDALAFGERLVAAALDGRMMNEAILLTILGRDEAKALRIVEPLYRAGRTHCGTPKYCWRVGVRKCRTGRPTWCIRDQRPHDGLAARRRNYRADAAGTKKSPEQCQGPAYS